MSLISGLSFLCVILEVKAKTYEYSHFAISLGVNSYNWHHHNVASLDKRRQRLFHKTHDIVFPMPIPGRVVYQAKKQILKNFPLSNPLESSKASMDWNNLPWNDFRNPSWIYLTFCATGKCHHPKNKIWQKESSLRGNLTCTFLSKERVKT